MNQRLRSFLVVAMVMALSFCARPFHEPPIVSVLEPANNALVSTVVRVRALAATHAGISEARLYIDGEFVLKQAGGSDSVLTFIWDASDMTPWSRHAIAVEVTDNDNRTGTSDSVSVVIAATSGPTSHDGPITKDETWYAEGSPHVVGTSLDVEAVLTIEPGSVVEFKRGGRLLVGNGALIAQGGSSMITFAGQETIPGFWKSIEFSDQARPYQSVLDNCLFEYGGGSGAQGNVVVNSPMRISNCIFRRSARVPLAIDPTLVPSIGDGNLFSDNDPNAILINGTDITRDTRWDDHGVPYLVEDGLYVEGDDPTATLTIGPGTTVAFADGADIEVDAEGAIVADGSSGIITLTSDYPDDWWGGIEIDGNEWPRTKSSDGYPLVQGVFKSCLIQNSGEDGAAIILEEAVIEMENSVISNSQGYGMNCIDGSYLAGFRDNVITGCGYKAMVFDVEYVQTIGDGNSFTGNDIYDSFHDGILLYNEWDGIVSTATWPNLGVPYILEDDAELTDESCTPPILTLAPGVRLEFDGTTLYIPEGALIADGTSGLITFTSYDNSEPWGGIVFETNPYDPQSMLRNCLFEYGGLSGGDIVCDECAPLITGNEINHSSQFGILLHHSSLNPDSLRADNRFLDNDSGDVAIRPRFIVPPAPRKVWSAPPHDPRRHEFRNHVPGPHLRRDLSEATPSFRTRLRPGTPGRTAHRPGTAR